jgi:hypothetical protein
MLLATPAAGTAAAGPAYLMTLLGGSFLTVHITDVIQLCQRRLIAQQTPPTMRMLNLPLAAWGSGSLHSYLQAQE